MKILRFREKRTSHPRRNFKVRQYIASKGIARLTIDFIVLNVTLAILIGILSMNLSGNLHQGAETPYVAYIELMGRDALVDYKEGSSSVRAVARPLLATASLVLPALFLGIIVYKFFVLKRDNIVFRDRCDLCQKNGENSINIYFYISSSLKLNNLRFEAFIRTYEKEREKNPNGFYPMNTFHLKLSQDSIFPIPFNYTPSRFRIPLFKEDTREPSEDYAQIKIGEGNRMTIHTPDRNIEIDQRKGDFCEIHIISQGNVPDIHSQFVENHCYRIPDDIAFTPLPEMKTSYNTDKNSFDVDNWKDF